MQINSRNRTNVNFPSTKLNSTKVSFGGQRLFPVNLKRVINGKVEFIPGFFTKMDDRDNLLVRDIKPVWSDTIYGNAVLKKYLFDSRRTDTYMIECPQFRSPEQRVQALAAIRDEKNHISLDYLQSATEINRYPQVQGAGGMMLYGLAKLAMKFEKLWIDLQSASFDVDSFYSHHFFESSPNSSEFILRKDRYPLLINMKIKKYNLERTE